MAAYEKYACIYKLDANYLQIFANLSDSDCSQSKSGCNCFPPSDLCNRLRVLYTLGVNGQLHAIRKKNAITEQPSIFLSSKEVAILLLL